MISEPVRVTAPSRPAVFERFAARMVQRNAALDGGNEEDADATAAAAAAERAERAKLINLDEVRARRAMTHRTRNARRVNQLHE